VHLSEGPASHRPAQRVYLEPLSVRLTTTLKR